ncbi:MAG: hypothetical protein N2321_12500, partial [Melioribacteraceae bacterium]|nr:hypothetical protein [Melioribacteraceae bacterium]
SNGAYMYNYGVNKKFYHYKLNVDDVFNLMNESIINHIINVFEVEKKLKKLNVNTNEFEIFDLNRKIFKQTSINLLRDLLNTERPITRYELMNIITERAKEFPFYKRKKIETIAGEMIS